jgi:hypothetical protein
MNERFASLSLDIIGDRPGDDGDIGDSAAAAVIAILMPGWIWLLNFFLGQQAWMTEGIASGVQWSCRKKSVGT